MPDICGIGSCHHMTEQDSFLNYSTAPQTGRCWMRSRSLIRKRGWNKDCFISRKLLSWGSLYPKIRWRLFFQAGPEHLGCEKSETKPTLWQHSILHLSQGHCHCLWEWGSQTAGMAVEIKHTWNNHSHTDILLIFTFTFTFIFIFIYPHLQRSGLAWDSREALVTFYAGSAHSKSLSSHFKLLLPTYKIRVVLNSPCLGKWQP